MPVSNESGIWAPHFELDLCDSLRVMRRGPARGEVPEVHKVLEGALLRCESNEQMNEI